MELLIGGAVVLLVGSFAAWKLLRKSAPSQTDAAAPAPAIPARPSAARQEAPQASPSQASAPPPVKTKAEQPRKDQDIRQITVKGHAAQQPAATPVPAHVEPLDPPQASKAAAPAKTAQGQPAAASAAETRPSAKDEAEDWLGAIPSLTARGNDDADTELVLEDD
jgi:hypothetical protein